MSNCVGELVVRALTRARRTLLPLGAIVVCAGAGYLCPAYAEGHSLWNLVGRPAELESFDVYHISETTTRPLRITTETLVASKLARTDFLHITATREIRRVLSNTALTGVCRTQGIDVRWAIVLNFADDTHATIGFSTPDEAECVSIASERNDVSVSRDLFDYVSRTFGFLNK